MGHEFYKNFLSDIRKLINLGSVKPTKEPGKVSRKDIPAELIKRMGKQALKEEREKQKKDDAFIKKACKLIQEDKKKNEAVNTTLSNIASGGLTALQPLQGKKETQTIMNEKRDNVSLKTTMEISPSKEEQRFLDMLSKDCNIRLTEEQKKVVLTTKGPIAVVAVPGSGKTTALLCRTANLIMVQGVNPSRILSVSFSRASATDMSSRFHKIFGDYVTGSIRFSTIHAFAYGVVKEYERQFGVSFTLIEGNKDISKLSIINKLYSDYNEGEKASDDTLDEIANKMGLIANLCTPREELDKINKKEFPCSNFLKIYDEYINVKRTNNWIDFDDMLVLCLHVLNTYPTFLEYYMHQYDYIQVDESQDVSLLQHRIIKLLASVTANVCLVGDPDQAIYEWRGASPEMLVDFKKSYKKSDYDKSALKKSKPQVLFMSRNFRSTKTIVNVANKFIKKNENRYDIDIYTENEKGNTINTIVSENDRRSLVKIIDKVKDCDDLREIAVLYRNNLDVLPIITTLVSNDIPFYIKDIPQSFFNHWIVKDILNIIAFSKDMCNVPLFESIYYKIKTYTPKKLLTELYQEQYRHDNVFDFLITKTNDEKRIRYLKSFPPRFRELREIKPDYALDFILEELHYEEYLEYFSKKFNYNMENIWKIISILKQLCKDIDSVYDIPAELDKLKEIIKESTERRGENVITLSTMHSSKGLEFDNVFLLGFVEGKFPTDIEESDVAKLIKHMESERRLAYVAITRARKNLYVMYPKVSEGSKSEPSIFLLDIMGLITKQAFHNKIKVFEDAKKGTHKVKKDHRRDYSEYRAGMRLNHNAYGNGEILDRDGDNMKVLFDDNRLRVLNVAFCVNQRLVTLIEED